MFLECLANECLCLYVGSHKGSGAVAKLDLTISDDLSDEVVIQLDVSGLGSADGVRCHDDCRLIVAKLKRSDLLGETDVIENVAKGEHALCAIAVCPVFRFGGGARDCLLKGGDAGDDSH